MDIIGKKVVSIFSSEDRVFTVRKAEVNERNEIDVEVFLNKPPTTTWFYGFNRSFRLATKEEESKGRRFKGSCPHKFISYDKFADKTGIPFNRRQFGDRDAWLVECCEWCGLQQKGDEVILRPIR